MCLVVALVAAVACFHGTSSSPTPDHHQLELKHHYNHLAYIADFKCHKPQARVLSVHHLLFEEQSHGKAFFPDVTVLHRCDEESGSCTSGHCCSPLHKEHVYLPFKVTFLHDFEGHKKGSWVMENHFMENHTECACKEHPPHTHSHIFLDPEPVVEKLPKSSYDSEQYFEHSSIPEDARRLFEVASEKKIVKKSILSK